MKGRRRHLLPILTMALLSGLLLTACGELEVTSIPTPARIGTPTTQPQVRTFDAIWDTINNNYVYADFGGVDWDAVKSQYSIEALTTSTSADYERVINNMLDLLPEGTLAWQTREARIEAEVASATTSTYQGIGAYVAFRDSPTPHLVLLSIIPGSPAETAGLRAHDSIFAVDGLPVTLDEGIDVVQRVRGPAGSLVTLSTLSPGDTNRRDIAVTRGVVNASRPEEFTFEYLGETDIMYIFVPRVGYVTLFEEFLAALDAGSRDGQVIGGMIIDLRVASNGTGWPLLQLLTTFTDGTGGDTFSRLSSDELFIAGQNYENSQDVPIILLVGPHTQGLPEIFASAMQENGRALVYGLPSAGQIEAFSTFAMPDGSELTLATSSYSSSEGVQIGLVGVQPDVILNIPWEDVSPEDDAVMNAAFQALLNAGG